MLAVWTRLVSSAPLTANCIPRSAVLENFIKHFVSDDYAAGLQNMRLDDTNQPRIREKYLSELVRLRVWCSPGSRTPDPMTSSNKSQIVNRQSLSCQLLTC